MIINQDQKYAGLLESSSDKAAIYFAWAEDLHKLGRQIGWSYKIGSPESSEAILQDAAGKFAEAASLEPANPLYALKTAYANIRLTPYVDKPDKVLENRIWTERSLKFNSLISV